jgi:hypothetical protein
MEVCYTDGDGSSALVADSASAEEVEDKDILSSLYSRPPCATNGSIVVGIHHLNGDMLCVPVN